MGPSGAGKTTLIKILTGQLKPNKGSAEIMKHDTVSLSGRSLFYFHKDSGLEIDFITPIDAEVTLVEVKAINGNAKSANTVLNNKDQYGVNRCINRREPPDFDTYIGTRLFYAWSKKAFIDSDGNEWEGGQIDLIIDRNDDIMNLCEMKYSSNELFSISPKYAKDVRDRMAMFRASEKTRKDLRCTFVTVYGVKQNPNSDIVVDQVILDNLFT